MQLLTLAFVCYSAAQFSFVVGQEPDNGRCKPSQVWDDASSLDDSSARSLECTYTTNRTIQIHLALTGNQTEMRISWKTTHAGCPNKVHYDVTPDYLQASALNGDNATIVSAHGGFAAGTTVSYSPNDMCGAPARSYKNTPLFFQSSVLTGLVPGQRYYYRLHGDKHVYSFRAAPKVGPHVHTSFLAYGDMGESTHKAAKAPGYGHVVLMQYCITLLNKTGPQTRPSGCTRRPTMAWM